MSYKAHAFVVATVSAGLALIHATTASALTLSYEQTSTGITGQGTATNYLQLPVSDTYTKTFTAPTPNQVGSTGFGFYDDYVFSVATASLDAVTSTIDFANVLNINSLQVRLYNFSGNPNLPVLGGPHGGAIDGWSQTLSIAPGTQEIVNVLPQKMLSAGTYVLEVRGNVAGTNGGSYTGSLNLVPTPLPAGLPMLISGLGLLGIKRWRKSAAT